MDKLELENDIITKRAHRAKKSKYGKKDQPRTMCVNYWVTKTKLKYCKTVKI